MFQLGNIMTLMQSPCGEGQSQLWWCEQNSTSFPLKTLLRGTPEGETAKLQVATSDKA